MDPSLHGFVEGFDPNRSGARAGAPWQGRRRPRMLHLSVEVGPPQKSPFFWTGTANRGPPEQMWYTHAHFPAVFFLFFDRLDRITEYRAP
jgi:hypothetical protein